MKKHAKKLIKKDWMNRMWILKQESSFYRSIKKYRTNNEQEEGS